MFMLESSGLSANEVSLKPGMGSSDLRHDDLPLRVEKLYLYLLVILSYCALAGIGT